MSFLRARRRGAVDVTVVRHQIEWLERRVRRIAAVHGLTSIADDHVLHHTPDDVIENCYTEEGEAVCPRNEDRSEDNERDAGGAVEVFLEVELVVPAGGAAIDDRSGWGSDDVVRGAAAFAAPRFLARFARVARVAFRAEEMN